MSVRLFLSCTLCLVLAACTSTTLFVQDETLDENNASTLIVYTPDTGFNRQNFIYPTIFIDGQAAGKVSINKQLKFFLHPGPHTIGFQRAFIIMPNFEAGNLDVQMEKGKTYYIRYSYDFDDLPTNDEPVTTGASSFSLVSTGTGEARE